mmetsp:Transcript_20298/g.81835  ORF Transcript_20298/g.81835 Transcript_20298/m.81835 type:complete len:126 (-) Transcript_20298:1382-1759(-)
MSQWAHWVSSLTNSFNITAALIQSPGRVWHCLPRHGRKKVGKFTNAEVSSRCERKISKDSFVEWQLSLDIGNAAVEKFSVGADERHSPKAFASVRSSLGEQARDFVMRSKQSSVFITQADDYRPC